MALEKVHFLASSKNRLWRYRCDMLWQAVPKLHTGDQNSTVTDGWHACTSDDENTIIVEPQNLLAGAVHQLVLCHIDKDIKLELDLFRCLQLTWLMEEQSDFVKLRWTELQLDSRIHCQLKPLDDVMGCWWGLRCHSLAMTEQEMPPATGVWVLALIAGCCGVAIALQSRQRWSWQHVIALLSLLADNLLYKPYVQFLPHDASIRCGLCRYAVSVRLCVCHVPTFCQNEWTYLQKLFTVG